MPQLEGRGSARLRTFRQWTEGAHEPQAEGMDAQRGAGEGEAATKSRTFLDVDVARALG